jgi:hypothetical protein
VVKIALFSFLIASPMDVLKGTEECSGGLPPASHPAVTSAESSESQGVDQPSSICPVTISSLSSQPRIPAGPAPPLSSEEGVSPKPSKWKEIVIKVGLNKTVLAMVLKGACAPTIALAFYQASAVAELYTSLGYLVTIAVLLTMPILPRAKFVESIIASTVSPARRTSQYRTTYDNVETAHADHYV